MNFSSINLRRTTSIWNPAIWTLVLLSCVLISRSVFAEVPQTLEFSENQVAGGPEDFMTVRHLRMRGSNRDIGRKLGEIARQRHKVELEPLSAVMSQARRTYFERNYAVHFSRGAGAAEAFGQNFTTTTSDVFAAWLNIDIAPACSTVYYPPAHTASGHAILSRNYDFTTARFSQISRLPGMPDGRPFTSDVYVIEVYPDQGYPSLYVTCYDLVGGAMDGVNSEGLSVALLADDTGSLREPAGTQAGLHEVQIVRYLLDTCATVDDAKCALLAAKQYYSHTPTHYIIGDRSGRSFIWEYSRAHNKEYITDGTEQPQIITNHPVHKYKTLESMPEETDPRSSYFRMRRLAQRIAEAKEKLSTDWIKETNLCVASQVSKAQPRGAVVGRTLWHALYDSTDKSMEIDFYLGDDESSPTQQKRSGYLTFRLEGAKTAAP